MDRTLGEHPARLPAPELPQRRALPAKDGLLHRAGSRAHPAPRGLARRPTAASWRLPAPSTTTTGSSRDFATDGWDCLTRRCAPSTNGWPICEAPRALGAGPWLTPSGPSVALGRGRASPGQRTPETARRPMRITFVAGRYWPATGGAETLVHHVATALADRHDVTVVADRVDDRPDERLGESLRHPPAFSPFHDGAVQVVPVNLGWRHRPRSRPSPPRSCPGSPGTPTDGRACR